MTRALPRPSTLVATIATLTFLAASLVEANATHSFLIVISGLLAGAGFVLVYFEHQLLG